MTATPPAPPAHLFERELETAAAGRALEALCGPRGVGGVIVYRGEAGVGKTALLAQIADTARGRCTVYTARAGESTTHQPFHLVRHLLGRALATAKGAVAAHALRVAGPALGLTPPAARPADPQGVRDALDVLLAGLAEERASGPDGPRPVVLIADDAHWADGESLTWLASCAARLAGLPVLLVVAHRPEELADGSGETADHLTELARAARLHVTLQALSPEATCDLVRGALGDPADAVFCREVWAVTSGNPYETVELLAKCAARTLAPTQRSAAVLSALGTTARGSGIVARLGELDPECHRLAWAAAVLGTDLTVGATADLAGLTLDRARACVALLRAARILAPGTGAEGPEAPLDFQHPLVRTAVYRSVPPATRTALHGQAAATLTRGGHGPAAVSRHLLEIPPDEDPDAVRLLRSAAAEHLAVGAPDAARRCLERALREPPPAEERAPVLFELGCACLLTSPATTVTHLRAALELPGLTEQLRIEATLRLAQALAHGNQMVAAARCVADGAAATRPGAQRLRLLAASYMYEALLAEMDDWRARSEELILLADELPGSDNAERALLALRAFDAMLRGEDCDHITELCARTLVDGELPPGLRWTDTEWGFEIPALIGITFAFVDRPDEAEALFADALRTFEICGWSGAHLAFAHILCGAVERRRGRLTQAEAYLREGLRLADRVGPRATVTWDALCLLIDTLLARGHVEEARQVADDHDFCPPYPDSLILPDARSVHGRLLMALGRVKEARAELEATAASMAQRGRHNILWASWPFDLADLLVADDPDRASALVAEARRRAAEFGSCSAVGESLRRAAAFARPDLARVLLIDAVRELAASPSAYEEALARLDLAAATDDWAQARRALTLAETCGADGVAERARAVLSAIGGA
ncbi:AAA family ATPase [Streptomyces sp. VRA16 Mangrove soil]|uniref:ATP-binding protein n=1 Tax=Streptomyces sp. VRA16 Mangrove soil TaxID=2817434 RepID=UPI001A9E8B6E|nr:AAA family ATPase [Streptomyces sp. VRA16 Mangrove soil]MBO1330136.1 AAA family ATPase [Streptomyces sp. VRA16 Mangrove soil]